MFSLTSGKPPWYWYLATPYTSAKPRSQSQNLIEKEELMWTDYCVQPWNFFFYLLDFTFYVQMKLLFFCDRIEWVRYVNKKMMACSLDSQDAHLTCIVFSQNKDLEQWWFHFLQISHNRLQRIMGISRLLRPYS